MRYLLALILILVSSAPVVAEQSKIKELMSVMDCITYQFDSSHTLATLEGDVPVWGIINIGPASVVVRTNNDPSLKHVVEPHSNDTLDIFVGDTRFKYTLELMTSVSTAEVHVCQPRS